MKNSTTERIKDTTAAERFIDAFEERVEMGTDITDEDSTTLSGIFDSKEELEDGLQLLRDKADFLKKGAENADSQIKTWQKTKKDLQAQAVLLLGALGKALTRLKVSGNAVKSDGIKLSISSRSSLEVDEDWLLSNYEPMAGALQASLPPFVKVKLSLDKTALSAHLKKDNSLLVENPDKIHTKTSTSTSIK